MALIEYTRTEVKKYSDGSTETRIVSYTGLRALVEYVEDCKRREYL